MALSPYGNKNLVVYLLNSYINFYLTLLIEKIRRVWENEDIRSSKMKTYLFIDGTNLYASQYELFGPNYYLYFPSFIKEVENKIKVKFDKIYFYASYSPQPQKLTKKEKLYLKNEALFYRSVKSIKNLTFFTGYRSKTSGKEKEVDVKLAVDIVEKAAKNEYKNLFLLSGDADFMEALFSARRFNKKCTVICMENKIMYKAIIFFETRIIKITNKKLEFNKRFKKPNYLNLDYKNLLRKVD